MYKKVFNIANQITIFRIAAVPFIVGFMYIPGVFWAWVAFAFFLLASLSDFLDGHIARQRNLVTSFGKFLDPLADKLLVISILVVLVDLGRAPAWVVIFILWRELAVTGLRAVAASEGVIVAADKYGKIKTVFQLVALGFLIVHYPALGLNNYLIGQVLLYIALMLTVLSGINYFVVFYRNWLIERSVSNSVSSAAPNSGVNVVLDSEAKSSGFSTDSSEG